MPADITMTPTEASKLFEEKIDTLRESRNKAELEARAAIEQRDKTRDEVTTLQQEKSRAIEDIAQATQEAQRIRQSLAEHRANVEASLAQQETQSRQVIQQAADAVADATAQAQAVRQRQEQLKGIKQTFLTELASALADMTQLVQQTHDAMSAIPD